MTGHHLSGRNLSRRGSYLAKRVKGDLAAARRGPKPLRRRLARRRFDRSVFRLLRRIGL